MQIPTEGTGNRFCSKCTEGTLAVSRGVSEIHVHWPGRSMEYPLRFVLADVQAAGFTPERMELEPVALFAAT